MQALHSEYFHSRGTATADIDARLVSGPHGNKIAQSHIVAQYQRSSTLTCLELAIKSQLSFTASNADRHREKKARA